MGEVYCYRNGISLPPNLCLMKEKCYSIRDDVRGLRLEVCGRTRGRVVVDAIQLDIVNTVKNMATNSDGNSAEDDMGKIRALHYIITGSPNATLPEVVIAGYYLDPHDLLASSRNSIDEALALRNPFIGSFLRVDGNYHSVVLFPMTESSIVLYDPWDGYIEQFSVTQIFRTGFLTNHGKGLVKWIQYIRPESARLRDEVK